MPHSTVESLPVPLRTLRACVLRTRLLCKSRQRNLGTAQPRRKIREIATPIIDSARLRDSLEDTAPSMPAPNAEPAVSHMMFIA